MSAAATLIRWVLSLLLKFYRVVPLWLTLIVAASFISQICALLSLLLPLKVVMLLGSEKTPSYAVDLLPGFKRDELVVVLVAMTVSFFLLHMMLEKVTYIVTEKACSVLLSRTKKIVLFEDQNDVARAGFQRFAKILAGGVFVLAASSALFWLYLDIAIVVITYIASILVLYFAFCSVSSSFSVRLLKRRAASKLLTLISNIGFFLCFFFLVFDFLILQPPGIVFAIAGLLLSRQLFTKLSALAIDLLDLWDQKARVDVLFFHGKLWAPSGAGQKDQYWWMFDLSVRQKWLRDVANEIGLKNLDPETSELIPVGLMNVVGVKVAKDNGVSWYIFKVFGNGRQSYAALEFDILGGFIKGLPAPELVHISALDGYPVACYKVNDGRPSEAGELAACTEYIIGEISRYTPPEELVERYRRSKPMLWQRFDKALIERLGMAIPSHRSSVIQKLLERLSTVVDILSSLPLSVVVPEFAKESVWLGDGTPPVLLNWTQWSIEPLGAGLAEREHILLKLAKELPGRKFRELDTIGSAQRAIRVASLVYIAEEKIVKQRFREALSHVVNLLAVLDGDAVTIYPAWYGRFMELQQNFVRDEWVRSIINLVSLKPSTTINVRWRQTRLTGTFLLQVVDPSSTETVWIKVFAPNRYDIALGEYRFAEGYGHNLNVRYISFLRDGHFHVLVFTTPCVRGIVKSEYNEAIRFIHEALLAVEVPDSGRTGALTDGSPCKLVPSDLKRLYVAVNSSGERKLLDNLITRWGEACHKLAHNPHAIVVPDISPDAIFVSEKSGVKEYFLTNWLGWSLAPAGSGFDIAETRIGRLKLVRERVKQRRRSLAGLSVGQLELAALMYRFVDEVERARLTNALGLVPRLLMCLDNCD